MSIVLFHVMFVCNCVLYYCHRVSTQLQLNILYHISYVYHIISYHIISYHISYHLLLTVWCRDMPLSFVLSVIIPQIFQIYSNPLKTAYYLLLRGVGSSALFRLWEPACRTKKYKHSLSKGPLPLYKGYRVTESVLIGIFRVVQ